MMGQGGQSPILTSSCPSASVTDLSSRESNAWTLRGHHKSGPHAHRAITGEQEVRGRVSYRGLQVFTLRPTIVSSRYAVFALARCPFSLDHGKEPFIMQGLPINLPSFPYLKLLMGL